MDEIEDASAVQVVDFDGSDITDRVTLTGTIPSLELTAEPDVALKVARVRMQSPRSGLWPSSNVGDHDRVRLWHGEPLLIDARVRYTD